jgi:hypothetical protein
VRREAEDERGEKMSESGERVKLERDRGIELASITFDVAATRNEERGREN